MEDLTPRQKQLLEWIAAYIATANHPPSNRQMMRAMGLRSTGPIQVFLKTLRSKGYIDWTDGQQQSLHIFANNEVPGRSPSPPAADNTDLVSLPSLPHPLCFALRVSDDSLLAAGFAKGDLAIFRPLEDTNLPNGEIVAVRVGDVAVWRDLSVIDCFTSL